MRLSRILVALALVVPLVIPAPAGPALAQSAGSEVDFYTELTGGNEVPPVVTDGTGIAAFHVRDTSLDFLVVTNGVENITQAHIHLGSATENGPVEAFLFGFTTGGVTRDGTLSIGTLTEAELTSLTMSELVDELRSGDAYVNVHTTANPGGEVRGQIAPLTVPAGGFFTDTAGNSHQANINTIAAAAITLGCTATEYCPSDAVSRGQMAAFLNRTFNLPASSTDFFTDDNGSVFEDDINAVAAAGITKGCTATEYCPNGLVTRAQMASFLARALGLTAGGDVDMFTDDDGSTHEENINRIGVAGITQGTAPGIYSPDNLTLRDQMATFLARSTGWDRPDVPEGFSLTVLHNNDGESEVLFDGEFGGVAHFMSLLDDLRDAAGTDGTVLLSSGDNFLASPRWTASLEKGIPYYDSIAMNDFGYDAIALGNHDFDFGPDVTAEFILGFSGLPLTGDLLASFEIPPFLSANLDFSGEPNLQALVDQGRIAPSTMLTVNGQKIGVVGATTPALPNISSPRNVVVDPDVVGAVQAEVDKLSAQGADIVVMISHLQDIDGDLALAPDLSGVDIMIAGGGDELLANPDDVLIPGDEGDIFGPYPLHAINKDGRQIPVVTTSGQYLYVGQLVTQFDLAGRVMAVDSTSGPVRVSGIAPDAVTPDSSLETNVEDPVTAFVADLAADVIGTSEVALDGLRSSVRSVETNQGNLIADALLQTGRNLAASFGVASPDVALQNGGGIRNDSIIPAGDITMLDTFDMVPFPNFVTILPDIPRSQFKEILENAVSRTQPGDTPGGTGRFAQVGGFSFTYSSSGTAQVLDGDGNVVTPGTRVTEVTLDDATVIVTGGAVVAGPDLTIATIDFLARGGDEYPYRGASFTSLGVSYQQALADLIVDTLAGTISAADYPEGGEGRITNVP